MPGSNATTRQRKIPYPIGTSDYYHWYGKRGSGRPPGSVPSRLNISKSGTQITVSEGNPVKLIRKGSMQDIGSDFFTRNEIVELPEQSGNTHSLYGFQPDPGNSTVGNHWLFDGTVLPVDPALRAFSTDQGSSNEVLDELGATAISRCKPTNSAADLSTAVGEILKDGLPKLANLHLWKSRTSTARKASSEYLNQVFTNLPFLSEIKDTTEAVSRASKLIAQYERDAGKLVRRGYDFPLEKSETFSETGQQNQPFGVRPAVSNYPGILPQGFIGHHRTIVRKRWFRGGFRYYLPLGYDSRKEMDRYSLLVNNILGAGITPETIWELAPWSWAVDWFSNAGDVVKNVSSFATDGLVMQYGYMMETSIITDTYTYRYKVSSSGNPPVRPLTLTTIVKKRRKANPFGFGMSWEGLSPFQLSILAALGISRR